VEAAHGREILRERLAVPGLEFSGQFLDGLGREFGDLLGIQFLLGKVFVFCPPWQRSPLPRRTNAPPKWPPAPSRPRCQGRVVFAFTMRTSGRSRRGLHAGRAEKGTKDDLERWNWRGIPLASEAGRRITCRRSRDKPMHGSGGRFPNVC
jgi:hypothetical protein